MFCVAGSIFSCIQLLPWRGVPFPWIFSEPAWTVHFIGYFFVWRFLIFSFWALTKFFKIREFFLSFLSFNPRARSWVLLLKYSLIFSRRPAAGDLILVLQRTVQSLTGAGLHSPHTNHLLCAIIRTMTSFSMTADSSHHNCPTKSGMFSILLFIEKSIALLFEKPKSLPVRHHC